MINRNEFKLEPIITLLSEEIEPEMLELIHQYWAYKDDKPINKIQDVISKFSTIAKTEETIVRKISKVASVKQMKPCPICMHQNYFKVVKRSHVSRLKRIMYHYNCPNCLKIKNFQNQLTQAKLTTEYNLLKEQSLNFLKNELDEKVISLLDEASLKFLQIISDCQEIESQETIYKKALKAGLTMDENFFKMQHKLQKWKLICIHKKTNDRKAYLFIHPQTMEFLNNPGKNLPNCILLPCYKKNESYPDYTGTVSIFKEFTLSKNDEISIAINRFNSRVQVNFFKHQQNSMINIYQPDLETVKQKVLYKNFFYAAFSYPEKDITENVLRYTFKCEQPISLEPFFKMKVGIWKLKDHFKLKIEPDDLAFRHGITQLAD
jgi:hypothetical protein